MAARKRKTSVQFVIQAVPERVEYVQEQLLPHLPASTYVVVDDGPPPLNPWRNYQRCLSDLPNCTHAVVLQDDVLLCQNFVAAVHQIAEVNPDVPVVLFLPGGSVTHTAPQALRAMKRGVHYVRLFLRDFCPVVGMLWPRQKAIDFLHWTQTAKVPGPSNPRSDDAMVGYWAEKMGEEILVAVPSLVQHPDHTSVVHPKRAKSGADKGRVALLFCEGDPLEIDWSK